MASRLGARASPVDWKELGKQAGQIPEQEPDPVPYGLAPSPIGTIAKG